MLLGIEIFRLLCKHMIKSEVLCPGCKRPSHTKCELYCVVEQQGKGIAKGSPVNIAMKMMRKSLENRCGFDFERQNEIMKRKPDKCMVNTGILQKKSINSRKPMTELLS